MTQATALTRFYRLPRDRRRTLVRAAVAVAGASVAVALLPFRKAIGFGAIALRPPTRITVADCVWAVEAAAQRLPWRIVCIQKGLAAQRLLRGAGIDAVLHYGARRDTTGELEGHVWVSVAGETVIGGEEAEGFAGVAAFPLDGSGMSGRRA